MPIWQPGTHGCWCCHHSAADPCTRWTGAPIWQHRPTNYAQAAAESKPSSRIATLKTYLAVAWKRWICRGADPPLKRVIPKGEPLPSSSPNSGADDSETNRLGRRDDTLHPRPAHDLRDRIIEMARSDPRIKAPN